MRQSNHSGGGGHGTSETVLLSLALVAALIAVAGSLGMFLHDAITRVSAWVATLNPP